MSFLPIIQASVLDEKKSDDRDYLFAIYDEYFTLQAELGDEIFSHNLVMNSIHCLHITISMDKSPMEVLFSSSKMVMAHIFLSHHILIHCILDD